MNTRIWFKRMLKYGGIPLAAALALYLIWGGSNGWGGGEICAGIGLILMGASMAYIRQTDIIADRNVMQRVKAEYPAESQPQVLEAYNHLKTKELEYLFLKVLDDAQGDVDAVRKFTSLAESVGWKAFLENRW